jgi:hypothetical protein
MVTSQPSVLAGVRRSFRIFEMRTIAFVAPSVEERGVIPEGALLAAGVQGPRKRRVLAQPVHRTPSSLGLLLAWFNVGHERCMMKETRSYESEAGWRR